MFLPGLYILKLPVGFPFALTRVTKKTVLIRRILFISSYKTAWRAHSALLHKASGVPALNCRMAEGVADLIMCNMENKIQVFESGFDSSIEPN